MPTVQLSCRRRRNYQARTRSARYTLNWMVGAIVCLCVFVCLNGLACLPFGGDFRGVWMGIGIVGRQAAAAYHPSIHLLPQLRNLIKNYCPHDTDQFPSSFIFRIIGMSEDWDHLSLTLGHLVQSLPPPKLDRLLFTCQIRSAPGADCPPTSSIVLPPHHHHLFNGSPSRSRDFNLYLPHSVSQAQAQAQAQLKRGASN